MGTTRGEDEVVAAPKGVIMKISRQHGRLVGSTFSPRDLADVIELNKAYPKGYAYDAGQPVLEILLQEDEDAWSRIVSTRRRATQLRAAIRRRVRRGRERERERGRGGGGKKDASSSARRGRGYRRRER